MCGCCVGEGRSCDCNDCCFCKASRAFVARALTACTMELYDSVGSSVLSTVASSYFAFSILMCLATIKN